jgi:acyl carrier protein
MSGRPDRGALGEQLRALIAEFAPHEHGVIADDTPLISSALVESVALLNVALWVEEQVDAAVEITSFDLAAEWDTITQILDFVEKHRRPGRARPLP